MPFATFFPFVTFSLFSMGVAVTGHAIGDVGNPLFPMFADQRRLLVLMTAETGVLCEVIGLGMTGGAANIMGTGQGKETRVVDCSRVPSCLRVAGAALNSKRGVNLIFGWGVTTGTGRTYSRSQHLM